MTSPRVPRGVALLFRALLRVYPRAFRERHGDEMLRFFTDAWSDGVARGGAGARARVIVALSADALRSGLGRRLGVGGGDGDPGDGDPRGFRRESAVDSWLQDVRWALRSVRRRPGFAAVVVGTLALGVGANTAVFGVLNAVLLAPLPYEQPDRLVRLYQTGRDEPDSRNYMTLPALLHFRENARSLEIGAFYNYRAEGADITGGDRPERVRMLQVAGGYFDVLGVPPMLGRTFAREEEREGANVVVVSERMFRRYFAGQPDAVGSTLRVDGVPRTVLGVMPAEFSDPVEDGVDVWLPLPLQTEGHADWQWDNFYLSALARLGPGSTLESARSEIEELSRRQKELAPNTDQVGVVVPLKADVVGGARSMLVIVMAAVGLLLLIACVNVASLFLSRGAARATELAVRSALGSPRRRLVRQLLAESLVLALAGGAAGLALAWALSDALLLLAPVGLLPEQFTTIDPRVFAFAFGAALLSGVLFGIAPALRFTRPGLESVLREGGRSGAAGRAEGRARSVLVVAEFSLALVLLIGAGVLIASFDRLRNVELNLEPDNVLTFETHLPFARYADAGARARFHVEFERRVARIPGVLAAGAVSRLPGTGQYHRWGTRRMNGDGDGTFVGANQRVVEGDFFSALGIPLLSGRVFGPEDRADAPRAAVVNQTLVRTLFGEENPLGLRITTAGNELTIIGVVADVPIDARGEVAPKVYHSHTQFAGDRNWALTQVVKLRDAASTSSVLASAARELAAIDAELVIYEPRVLTEVIGRGVEQERFAMLLLAAFAALAVLLAGVGIYGVLAYAVSRRRAEIGIRMALGATTSDVQRMVVGHGIRLATLGILFGLAGALVLTRGLRSLVFGVSVTNPWIFVTCAATLTFIAVAASALPSFVATRVNPVESFRQG